jgi:hypothetical protein
MFSPCQALPPLPSLRFILHHAFLSDAVNAGSRNSMERSHAPSFGCTVTSLPIKFNKFSVKLNRYYSSLAGNKTSAYFFFFSFESYKYLTSVYIFLNIISLNTAEINFQQSTTKARNLMASSSTSDLHVMPILHLWCSIMPSAPFIWLQSYATDHTAQELSQIWLPAHSDACYCPAQTSIKKFSLMLPFVHKNGMYEINGGLFFPN